MSDFDEDLNEPSLGIRDRSCVIGMFVIPRRSSSVGEEYWCRVIGRADWPEHLWNKWSFTFEYLWIFMSDLNETPTQEEICYI